MTPDGSPELVAPRVAFEVERFEWTSPDRLELVGRWFGLRGHRFLRPTLDVEVDGERRRMLAVLEHKPWAAEEGEEWIAAFTWRGDPAHFDDAELTVSPDLAVQLPVPEGSTVDESEAAVAATDRLPARRPRMAVLENELNDARAEGERLSQELSQVRAAHSQAARELRERVAAEQAKARELETQLEKAGEQLAAAEAAAARELEETLKEKAAAEALRDEAVAARDAATAERDAALAARETAAEQLAAAERQHDALVEARDRARQERNAWMSRARAAATSRPSAPPPSFHGAPDPEPDEPPPAPTPREAPAVPADAGERRTIQIGERPGPLRREPPAPVPSGRVRRLDAWGPRVVAVLALLAFLALVAVLLAWAL
jgi:hypothetical protein